MTTTFVPETAAGPLPETTDALTRRGFWTNVRYWLGNWKLTIGLILIMNPTGLYHWVLYRSLILRAPRLRPAL
ncbi:MAG: hypothetical protein R2932_11265 [Caldilineaceae bacterium]